MNRVYALMISVRTDRNLIFHDKIKNFLLERGFELKGGNLYLGTKDMNSVDCILAIQKLSTEFDWFYDYVKDVEMFRIEEKTDLLRVVKKKEV